nr:uncharacterized protein LOC123773335 [Procambarus clarkii]
MVEQMADEARFFVYSYNATTLVTTAGLAMGLFFIITAIALYYYYYVEVGLRRNEKYRRTGTSHGNDRTIDAYFDILDLLEKAWAIYAVESQDCRRRVVCEAHLPSASLINQPVAGVLTELFGQVTEEMLGQMDEGDAASVRDLQLAAQYGRTVRSCQAYERHCPDQQLATLPQN